MKVLAVIFGIVLVVLVAQDAFETIVLPRRVTRRFRLARLFTRTAYFGWNAIGRRVRSSARRDSFYGYMGPLTLLTLLAFWAVLFVLGFALVLWGLALPLSAPDRQVGFLTDLYLSGTTFFTLGLGDVTPLPGIGRMLLVGEVALMISYMPILYQSFSRRELRISLLDARAGSPPTAVELLRRNCVSKNAEELALLLREWEAWRADILESHLSYPILAYYRSQHEQQSWVGTLTLILDTCALTLTNIDGIPLSPARFAFAMARHAVVDLAQVLNTPPIPSADRLSAAEFTRLQKMLAETGLCLRERTAGEQDLASLRATYEPFVSALAERIQVSLPPWIPPADTPDDWETSAWDDRFPNNRKTLKRVFHQK